MSTRADLWGSADVDQWRRTFERYDAIIARQKPPGLPALDHWYHHVLPTAIAERSSAYITHDELVRITEWKMTRGIFRAPNLILVRGNAPELVARVTREALAQVPHPTTPIATVATLAGVGPATSSAVVAAYRPDLYPFFDELVAAQVPLLGKVDWTMTYYAKYARALRDRAAALGDTWNPAMVERALWTHVGGKAGAV